MVNFWPSMTEMVTCYVLLKFKNISLPQAVSRKRFPNWNLTSGKSAKVLEEDMPPLPQWQSQS